METAEVAAAVAGLKADAPQARLVITGGEPLEQDLGELLADFRRRRHVVALETNGLHFQDLPIDWWTVSPKDAAGYRVHPRLWAKAGEIKLLVTPALDLARVKKIRGRTRAPIILQPERHDPQRWRRTFAFFRACAACGIPDVRLGLQLHAVFRIPDSVLPPPKARGIKANQTQRICPSGKGLGMGPLPAAQKKIIFSIAFREDLIYNALD